MATFGMARPSRPVDRFRARTKVVEGEKLRLDIRTCLGRRANSGSLSAAAERKRQFLTPEVRSADRATSFRCGER